MAVGSAKLKTQTTLVEALFGAPSDGGSIPPISTKITPVITIDDRCFNLVFKGVLANNRKTT